MKDKETILAENRTRNAEFAAQFKIPSTDKWLVMSNESGKSLENIFDSEPGAPRSFPEWSKQARRARPVATPKEIKHAETLAVTAAAANAAADTAAEEIRQRAITWNQKIDAMEADKARLITAKDQHLQMQNLNVALIDENLGDAYNPQLAIDLCRQYVDLTSIEPVFRAAVEKLQARIEEAKAAARAWEKQTASRQIPLRA